MGPFLITLTLCYLDACQRTERTRELRDERACIEFAQRQAERLAATLRPTLPGVVVHWRCERDRQA